MEEVLPPYTDTGAGFEPTRIRQFTIFLQNKVGRLQQLVRAFEEQAARIVALSIEESGDAALVRIICSDPDLGKQV
ncbi:MAG: acetolactate synthase, partial [Phycisphaerae bacterium]